MQTHKKNGKTDEVTELEILLAYSNLLKQKGLKKKAVELLERVLKIDKNNIYAMIELAKYNLKKPKEALDLYQRAVSMIEKIKEKERKEKPKENWTLEDMVPIPLLNNIGVL